jgi:4-amino-4-deoxy-L-arabinose transferase-like glycosyltransferase
MALILTFKTYAHPVPWEYETIADNLLAGRGYSFKFLNTTYMSFNTPLFGFLCAAVYRATNHSHFPILAIQSLFTVALALLIFSIAKTVFTGRVGLLAAALVSFHPGLLYYDVFNLLPLSIDSFLIAAIAFVLLRWKDKPSLWRMAVIGALIGIAVLSRGITSVLLPLVMIYTLVFSRLRVARRLLFATGILCAAIVVLAPWLIRNYSIHRQVLISSTSGENLWRGNNALATGTSLDSHNTPIFDLWPEDFRKNVYAMTELQQKEFFEKEAFRFMRDRPWRAFGLYLRKVYYFWWFSPQSGILYPQRYLTVYKPLYVFLLVFSLVGFLSAMRSSKSEARELALILMGVMISICLGQSLFYVEGRHRWLIEPLLLVFFSCGVFAAWKLIRTRVWTKAQLKEGRTQQSSILREASSHQRCEQFVRDSGGHRP